MILFNKILAAGALLTALVHTPAWALDKTDFQALTPPADEQTFNAFASVPLYYLESPRGTRLVTKIPAEPGQEPRSVIHFFLTPQFAEAFQTQNSTRGTIKEISMASVLSAVHTQSRSNLSREKPFPDLLISSDETSREISFFHLTETVSGRPYTLEFRKKKIIPAFLSMESAEKLSKIISASGSHSTSVTQNSFSEFLLFLKNRRLEGLPVRVFPYAGKPRHTEVRPMTWGVGSSYLFGTVLVLFILWAITRGSKHK